MSKPSSEGMEELRLLSHTFKVCRLVSRPSCVGMEELRLLPYMPKCVSACRLPRVVGKLPTRLLPPKLMDTTRLAPFTEPHPTPSHAVPLQG